MKFTLSWLKDHLDTQASLEEIAHKLVTLGLEVESITNPAENLKGFVVGQVVKREKHPHADRLNLCQVDAGTGELIQVICGAHNVREGMKAVFAPLGTLIPETGQALKKGVIRQIESYGMLCSSRELLLGTDHDGIMDLDTDAKPGTPFIEILKDLFNPQMKSRDLIKAKSAECTHVHEHFERISKPGSSFGFNLDPVIELSLTPNRSDCFGVRGIARDLAAGGLGTLKPLPYPTFSGSFDSPIHVEILDSKACPDFRGVSIRGVKNGPSPDWVQHRLKAVGLKPISALVDVTNYLNYDLCRPLHVFDADKLSQTLSVGLSQKGQSFDALNDKTYALEEGMTIIWDKKDSNTTVLSLAGIMGGVQSSCSEQTTNVFLECAAFDPILIANTGRRLQLLSDSRTRFERGVDPQSLEFGLNAAVSLILDWCGGEASHVTTAKHLNGNPPKIDPRVIDLTQNKLWSLSGYEISLKEAGVYLQKLGFESVVDETSLRATVPSHRPDVEGPEDLIEEILRLVGYDTVPAVPLPQERPVLARRSPAEIARYILASRGFYESVTWSFLSEEKAKDFSVTGSIDPTLLLSNPISSELSHMRPSLLPNLIDGAIKNANRGYDDLALFEVGPVFGSSFPHSQTLVAGGLRAGQRGSRHWLAPQRNVDVFDVKADVIALLKTFGLGESNYQIEANALSYYHPGRSGTLKQGNRVLAYFGEVHPKIVQTLNAEQILMGFEVFLETLPPIRDKKSILALSPYQAVTRDFAFVMDKSVPADKVIKTIQKTNKTLITQVNVFDVYAGEKVGENKKSLAIEVRLEPTAGTLTDEQIQEISTMIIHQVEKTTGATLRQ
jgi:phenylalanyl-tRNA synthetase beta chain